MAAADDALETVNLEINSPGGSVFDGYRVFNALESMKQRGVEVVATVNGKAASMATVILMAADKRQITKGSAMLVHDASVGTHGNAAEHLKSAKILEAISGEISTIYAEKTGASAEEMRELMAEDRWMTASESLERGFVHEVLKGNKPEKIDKPNNSTQKQTTNMSILDKFKPDEALTAKVDSLETDLAASLTELQGLQAEVITKDETISELQASLATTEQASKELATQAAETAEAVAKAEVDLKAAKESAGEKAAEMLAQAAHPQIEADNAAPATDETLVAEYIKLPVGSARADFRAKHPSVFARFDEITKPTT